MSKTLAIIPARYASTRFPGKPLVEIAGKTMIQRVYEQVQRYKGIDHCIIATENEEIKKHCEGFATSVFMTSANHPSGTDRCIEALEIWKEMGNPTPSYLLNIQGDEPFIHPEQLQLLHHTIEKSQGDIATLIKKIEDVEELSNASVVKVVKSQQGKALYFSRQAIPFQRNENLQNWLTKQDYFKHIGLYAFKTEALAKIKNLQPSGLEKSEALEQLRWLENGLDIYTTETQRQSIAIDTPEDLLKLNLP